MSELPTGNAVNLLIEITKGETRDNGIAVMILDDEYIILDGLCSFPWSDYKMPYIHSCKNGLEGAGETGAKRNRI